MAKECKKNKNRVGFTGTRNGMTLPQKKVVQLLLREFKERGFLWLHIGDCVGADTDAYCIAKEHNMAVHIHPPDNPSYRSFLVGAMEDLPNSYRERNKAIVKASEALLATPEGFTEIIRSGTWSTIRYARRQKRPIIIIWPDGKMTREN